jgi:hypothetical protein
MMNLYVIAIMSTSTQSNFQQLINQVQVLTHVVLTTKDKIKPCQPNKFWHPQQHTMP